MNCFSEETRHGFERTLGWLNQWACSRSFGLGTRIPWDEQFLVESLSDSTIYMAYYTVAHFLQNGDMYGSNVGSIKPEHLTDEVWDFLFCRGPYPQESAIDPNVLGSMKREFEYWYPIDLRVSGKDLVGNHLTFSIYNHTAIMEKRHWQRGFRCNGHILLNSEKMSKSTGNFRTLKQAIEEFSADATRFALADAGDGVDDANFAFETAKAAILRLTKEISWIEKVTAVYSDHKLGKEISKPNIKLRFDVPSTYADRVFQNEINLAVKLTDEHYRSYMFREALKTGFYDLQAARDEYRISSDASGGMNWDLVAQFLDVQTRLIAPICPHYGEHVWRELLKKEGFVIKVVWPSADPPDLTLLRTNKYLLDLIVLLRKNLHRQVNKKKKGSPHRALIYVNENYEAWKVECLKILQSQFNPETCKFAPDDEFITALQQSEMLKASGFKKLRKLCMPFMRYKKDETRRLGPVALESRLPFRELEVLSENRDLIKKQLGFADIEVLSYSDPIAVEKAGTLATVVEENPPSSGSPTAIFLPPL